MPPGTKKPVYIRGSGSTHNVYEGDGVVRMGRFRHWHWGHVLIPGEKERKKKTKHIHYVDRKGTITTETRPESRDRLLPGVEEEDNGGDGHGDGGDGGGHDDGHGDGGGHDGGVGNDGHGDAEGEPVDALIRLHDPDEVEDEDKNEGESSAAASASQTTTTTDTITDTDSTADTEASVKPPRLYRYTDRHGNITVTRHRLSRTPPEIGWVYRDGTILLSPRVAKPK